MGISKELKPLFSDTASITKRVSSHSDGYPTPGFASSGISYSAHIERGESFVRTETGQINVARRKVFLYSSTGWATTSIPRVFDKLTLPESHPPRNPQMLSVSIVSDERGLHHLLILTEF